MLKELESSTVAIAKQYAPSKTSAPNLPLGIVQRERLFRQLDRNREKPVIWITGPGGSGKTTLAASYLEARDLPCLWYQVDEKDADPAAFFYHMGLAYQEHTAGRMEPLPLLTPEYLAGLKTFTRRYFEKLFESLSVPSMIVFDNYQDVPPLCLLSRGCQRGLVAHSQGPHGDGSEPQ